ncbi:LysR family transcriptional regulator [Sneathiella sp. P13V-1]|uniref:LysR family transcriptional regulator n=1 Tax=Sneathiella sp. P13V-1 TaxID=2697366 RepID=UPI00187BC121|nr:LysR family transcriptional regulator [Sneathiella sp. P13V-1]MBE7637339.1 LysR family transcriptional regulator [Sneathiella sp. P13V-1]
MDWNGIRDFLAVIEAGSLTSAAQYLNVSQPTLSRRLSALEEALGAKLLIRTPRHLQLTEAGKQIYKLATRMGEEAVSIENIALGLDKQLAGKVRISVTEIIGINWLTPILKEFNVSHPGILIDLQINNDVANLQKREADIALRLMPPSQQEIVARHIGDIGYALYASRDYIERYGNPTTQEALSNHVAVNLAGNTSTAQWMRQLFDERNISFQFSTLLGVHRAVEAGLGIGPLLCYFGDKDPNLIRISFGMEPVLKEAWLCTLPEIHSNARIKAVYNFIRTKFAKERAEFKG